MMVYLRDPQYATVLCNVICESSGIVLGVACYIRDIADSRIHPLLYMQYKYEAR